MQRGSGLRWRAGKGGWAAMLAIVGLATWLLLPTASRGPIAADPNDLVTDNTYFFRLTAKYLHGDEPVDFDIVVGCGVRFTAYRGTSIEHDVFIQDPWFFVRRTRDGGAVLQNVPNACHFETTDNGQVPKDLLPGAVWFDDATDLSLGIAYVTEDAFENPNSRLKFLGATISRATRAEWETFRPIAAQNLLPPGNFTEIPSDPPVTEIKANLWNMAKLKEWRHQIGCHSVARYRLTDPASRELLRQYWPSNRPRFWMPPTHAQYKELYDRLFAHGDRLLVDGTPYKDYFRIYERPYGFPTRARGGTLYYSWLPSKIYPIRADEAMPWATPKLYSAVTIYRDIDSNGGANLGFAYCYGSLAYGDIGKLHLPNYFERQFATRIDGMRIDGEASHLSAPDSPPMFFEADEYFWVQFNFWL